MIPAGGDRLGDVAPGAQQLLGFCDEVVEVQHVAVRQPHGVFAVQARVLRRQPIILDAVAAEPVQERPALLERHVEPAQNHLLVLLVGDAEPRPQARRLRVLAQQGETQRVDRAPRDRVATVPQRVLQPEGDLLRRPIRERHRADALGRDTQRADEMIDTGDEAERLPRARARDHEDGPRRRFNGEPLPRERIEGHARNLPISYIAHPHSRGIAVTLPEPNPLPDDSWAVDERSLKLFVDQLQEPPADRAWYELRREAERIALVPGFDRLITLDANAIKELPHQIDVAQRVLRDMGGRAILADEVGLGKTIEASIIYKELAIRGLARRVLILTPASLVGQWQGELEEKFFERFDTPTEADDWQRITKAIISHDRARSRRHAEEILRHRWDLVIVDEAHKVKSHRGATYRFIEKIERDFILLLTATPLQNDLRELYNLITLLRPGQLGTWQEFKAEHLVSGDHRQPRDAEALRALTHAVMIRTRRSSVALDLNLPPRRPRHPEVKLTRAEADLYERTTEFLRRLYREGFIKPVEQEEAEDGKRRRQPTKKGILQLALIHLRQRLCSSARALAESLQHLGEAERISPEYRAIARQLAQRAQRIKTHAKLDVLTKLLKETPDRVVVFSDHRPTIQLIEERVKQLGRKPIVYWGAHSTAERDTRIRDFHQDPRSVLIATRAGSEGRNLQFCNVLVNYDLPWNPMVVEERIGRLHRIGQTREVHIVNLAAAGTIESYILQLLDQKIKLFELVVGELDLILGEFGGAQKFEGRLAKEWLAAESEADFARRVEAIGVDIEQSSAVGKDQEALNSLIAPDDNALRLERRFQTLSVPGRLRLGLGTSQLVKAAGWDAKRHRLGVHVTELLEALESIEPIGGVTIPQPAGSHPEYGELVRLTGLTSAGRAITLVARVDRLPLVLVDIEVEAA